MRVALIVEYDGSQYHGWQAQTGLRTVQATLEHALSQIANHEVSIVCAGRTDTGVHATHQVIHFESDNTRSIRSWVYGVNSFLPKDMCVRFGKEVPDNFHARYSATARQYRYIIQNTSIRPVLMRVNVTWQYRQLDAQLMHDAAQYLVGEHDFTSFRSVECQSKTPMRRIMSLNVRRFHDYIAIDVHGNAFLHHMVRNIAGVLMAVGSERKPVEWVQDVLIAKDRKQGAETAPASGLYLIGVTYPEEFGILRSASEPIFWI